MGGKKSIIIPSAPGMDPADDSDRATWAAMRHYGQVKADIRKRQFEQEGLDKLQETVGDKITRHTEYHYSFQLNRKRVDFWPSRGHWRYENKKYHGTISNLCSFVANRKGI